MRLRIEDGYLEISTNNSGKASISLPYLGGTVYGTPEILKAVDKYHQHRETPFDWPDMWWDPNKEEWFGVLKTDLAEYKSYELNEFIQMCRGNQNVS